MFGWFKKEKPTQRPPVSVVRPQGSAAGSVWVLQIEHGVLRIVSLGVSLATSLAIRQIVSLWDAFGPLETAAGWIVALSVGVLGYFCSRGLAYRLMQKESVWSLLPACLVVELAEIVCNYVLAVRAIQGADWVGKLPVDQRGSIVFLLHGMLSVLPLLTITLAVMDMDLERKGGHALGGTRQPPGAVVSPKLAQSPGGAGPQQQYQPVAAQRPPVSSPRQPRSVQPQARQFNGVRDHEDVTELA